MVQLIAIGLVGGLGWYAYKAFQRQMASVSEELKKAEQKKGNAKAKQVDALEQDEDGVYRPKKTSDED